MPVKVKTLLIGEKINTSRKEIQKAVVERDAGFIRAVASRQAEAGAHYIDVNCGTFMKEEEELMTWLVKEVQDEVKLPLCIDSPNPQAVEAGLKEHNDEFGKPMINSISGEAERYEAFLKLAREYDSKIVVLCMDDEHGIPKEWEVRLKIASRVVDGLEEAGVKQDDIYVDPLIQPISTNTANGLSALEVIRQIKEKYPGIHATCGLSNVSFGLPKRHGLNRIYMVMCMTAGLDSLILDPNDTNMMTAIITAEALLNKDPYCTRYLKAYRENLL